MSTARIQALLEAQLQTVAGLPTTQTENTLVNRTGSLTTPWSRSTLQPARTQPLAVGYNAMKQMQGNYQVDCFYPINSGAPVARAMADLVAAAFPAGLRLTDGVITVEIVMASVLQSNPGPQNYYGVPVQVQWNVFI